MVTEEMREAGSQIVSDLLTAHAVKYMAGLGGSKSWEEFEASHNGKNMDLIKQYVNGEIDSVTAIYIAMYRESIVPNTSLAELATPQQGVINKQQGDHNMLTYRQEELEKQSAWDVLHSLQSDLDYFLQETNSRGCQELPKHALDMMLKRTVCELQRAKDKILTPNTEIRGMCPKEDDHE